VKSDTQELVLGEALLNAWGDRYFAEINGTTFRDQSASQTYDERFLADGFSTHSLYIICGTDSGLFPKYLNSRPLPEGSTFLFIERPEVVELLPQLAPEIEDVEAIRVTTLDDFAHLAANRDIDHFFYRRALFLVPSFGVIHNPHPACADLAWKAQQAIDRLSLNLGVQLNNRFFFLTILQNLAENRTHVRALEGVFAGRTAVVLGAGPSLDEFLPWVKRHRECVDVLAVSRTSRRLLQDGVEPDFVFSIDPQAISFDVGKEMLCFGPQTVLVNNTHACPQLVGQWPWRNLYWGTRLPWEPSADGSPGNTVTHLAVWTAVLMGYSKIVLIGVDLCFSQEGHTHAKGSGERDAGPNLLRGAVEIETNAGRRAETDYQMAQGIEEMGRLAEGALRRNVPIINVAPTAARIPNVKHAELTDIHFEGQAETAVTLVHRILSDEKSVEREKYYRITLQELEKTRRALRRIQTWAQSGLEQIRKAFQEENHHLFRKHNQKIDAIENRIRRAYPHLRNALIQLQAGDFTQVLRPNRDIWERKEIEEASKLIFNGYLRSADDLTDHLREAEARISSRLEEEKTQDIDLRILLTQWQRDRQPGRARIWRHRGGDLSSGVPASVLDQLNTLDQEFEASLAQERRVLPGLDLGGVRRRAAAMLDRVDREGLRRVLAGLKEHSGPKAEALRHLVAGYASESTGAREDALEHYSHVSAAGMPQAREDAVRRMAVINLQARRVESALAALQELTVLCPSTRPEYARVLKLAGRVQDAIEQYTRHLSERPGDAAVMLQLGDLYRDLGAAEPARMAYEYVLALVPDDTVALRRLEDIRQEGAVP